MEKFPSKKEVNSSVYTNILFHTGLQERMQNLKNQYVHKLSYMGCSTQPETGGVHLYHRSAKYPYVITQKSKVTSSVFQ